MPTQNALKAIKTLSQVALESEDVEVLHRHFQLILNVIEKLADERKRSEADKRVP